MAILRSRQEAGKKWANDRAIWVASVAVGLLGGAIGAVWTGGFSPLAVALAILAGSGFARNSFRIGRPDWKGEFLPWLGWADAWRRCLARLRQARRSA